MKILFLSCSPRKSGYTVNILKGIEEGIAKEHSVEWVDVNALSIKPCMGCLQCRPDKACALPEDDAHIVGRKIAAADVLIIGSPTYWGNMTGPLKTLIDRNVTVFEYIAVGQLPKPRQKGKKGIIVTVSNCPWPINMLATQSAGAIRAMKVVLQSGGYKIAGIINYADAAAKGELAPKVLARAKKLGSLL
jgi:multimeric flavodoxin WrbA